MDNILLNLPTDPFAVSSWRDEEREETTFWMDFTIADAFGLDAIQDTFNRAFSSWKDNVKYITELSIVLNHKIWFWYYRSEQDNNAHDLSVLYDKLWRQVDDFAHDTFKGEDAQFYFDITD